MSSYKYEETSGYYYDASTGLYYDAKSQYYFNSKTKEYMYWSADHSTYLPAAGASASTAKSEPEEGAVVDKKKVEKVKSAKNIAKQMEKWAKTLNQKKEKAQTAAAPAAPEPEKSKLEKAREALNRKVFSILIKDQVDLLHDLALFICSGENGLSPWQM